MVKLKLLSHGCPLNTFRKLVSETETTDLTEALKIISNPLKIKILLENGAKLNATDEFGRTVLFYNIQPLFLKNNLTTAVNVKGITDTDVVVANSWRTDIYGATPLFYASNSIKAGLLLKSAISDNENELFHANLDWNPQGIYWHIDIAKRIYVNLSNKHGQTALFHNFDIVDWLIDNSSNINHSDNDGDNALFYANDPIIARKLVNADIDVFHKNKQGDMCVDTLSDPLALDYLHNFLGVRSEHFLENPIHDAESKIMEDSRIFLQRQVRNWMARKQGFELI
jgi:hypothetical protein